MSIDWRLRLFLKELSDGKWHEEIKDKRVGIQTILTAAGMGLVLGRQIKEDSEEDSFAFRITRKGKSFIK